MYRLQCVPIREVSSFQKRASMELGPEDVSLLERCPHFNCADVEVNGKQFAMDSESSKEYSVGSPVNICITLTNNACKPNYIMYYSGTSNTLGEFRSHTQIPSTCVCIMRM